MISVRKMSFVLGCPAFAFGQNMFYYNIDSSGSQKYVDSDSNHKNIDGFDSINFMLVDGKDFVSCFKEGIEHIYLFDELAGKFLPVYTPDTNERRVSVIATNEGLFFSACVGKHSKALTHIYKQFPKIELVITNHYRLLGVTSHYYLLFQVGHSNLSEPDLFKLCLYDRTTETQSFLGPFDSLFDLYLDKNMATKEQPSVWYIDDQHFVVFLEQARVVVAISWSGEIIWRHVIGTTPAFYYQNKVVYILSNLLCIYDPLIGQTYEISISAFFEDKGLFVLQSSRQVLTEDGWFIFPVSSDFVNQKATQWHSLWALNIHSSALVKLFDAESANGIFSVNAFNYAQNWLSITYTHDYRNYMTELYYRIDKPLSGFGVEFIERYSDPQVWKQTGMLLG